MNHSFRQYFGNPVDIDGKITSCVDVLYDAPTDRGRVVSLHPNLTDNDCDSFIEFCQKNDFIWERGAKRFYVTRSKFKTLQKLQAETGIELVWGLSVLADFGSLR